MSRRPRPLAILGGRNTAPLNDSEVRRAIDTFLGLDAEVGRTVRYEASARTVFRVVPADESETGEEYGEIVLGPDIYPGANVASPNSFMTLRAAAAHEAAHYHRWHERLQLSDAALRDLDEALTSLEAVQLYGHILDLTEIEQLVGDAHMRLSGMLADLGEQPPGQSAS